MLKIEIHECTPHNMLRAIRAACNELLGETHADLTTQAAGHVTRANELQAAADAEAHKAAAALCAHNRAVGEQPLEQKVPAGNGVTDDTEALQERIDAAAPQASEELDSTGAEWNPELHASTKAKNQDGTWKKRRGAGQNVAEIVEKQEQQLGIVQTPSLPPLPPAPPAPATPLVTMNDIYALISGGKFVFNDVIAAAQAMGFSDVGAFSRDASPEQRAQLLAELTKEVA